ncbi:uncharacterized protein LOC123260664 isoform X2 [Cotesia glomerata]|uniref:uncharacterized protein LOC123260664 isoform X2 n=1 Tax=Cotesia glomerata TaxID=32391 RepID=UPI001D007CA2|nr:uncharacterized protein LOC123260664 isoform X2 [Cotesia glomerata]
MIKASRQSYDEKFREFLEVKLREVMKQGDIELGIPVLDPFVGNDKTIEYNSQNLAFIETLNDFYLKELSSYVVESSNLNLLKFQISFNITFPKIVSSGLYQFDGMANQDIPIYGKGNFQFVATNFSISAVLTISVSGGVRIKSLDLKLSLEKIEFSGTGIFYDNSTSIILSQVISDVLPEIVTVYYHDDITAVVSEKIIDMANEKLEGKTWEDLLQLLG